MGAFQKYKDATDSFSLAGGVDNLMVFKRGGQATFAGVKDSFRLEDGTIIRGKDFRKSEEYQSASSKQKRAYRTKLKAGSVLTDKEMNLLLDDRGDVRPDVVSSDEDINETLKIASTLADMEEKKDEFLADQDERTLEFERRSLDQPEDAQESTDPGEAGGDLSRKDIFALVDREMQEWKNELEAALTPPGPAE